MTDARNAILGADAADRGWGPPCPSSSIVPIAVGGRTFNVHRRAASLFRAFLTELVTRGYRIDTGTLDDWSYVCRHIRNDPSLPWSNHAWGLAIDVNSLTNPMTSPLRTDMPAWVRDADRLLSKYGLRWGGAYRTSTPDPMHFEVMVTPTECDRLVSALTATGGWWTVSIPETELDRVEARYRKALGIDASTTFLTAVIRVLRQGTTGDPDVPMIQWSANLRNTLAAVNAKADQLAAAVKADEARDAQELVRDTALMTAVTLIDPTGITDDQVHEFAARLAEQLQMDPDVILDRLVDRLADNDAPASNTGGT